MKTRFLFFALLFSFILSAQPFTQRPSLPASGRHRTFGFAVNGHGYMGGGWVGLVCQADLWDYEAATSTWTQRAALPVNCVLNAPAFGSSTHGFVITGSATWRYDPVQNSWSNIGSAPAINYSSPMQFGNDVYLVGNSSVMHHYDITTNQWTQSTVPFNTYFDNLSFAIGNYGYYMDYVNVVMRRFDHTNGTWSNTNASYNWPLRYQAISFAAGGKGYIAFGQRSTTPYDNLNDFWQYDPVLNVWQAVDECPCATREYAAWFVIGNKAYFGTGTNGINLSDFWELNPFLMGTEDKTHDVASVRVYPNPSSGPVTFAIDNFDRYRDLSPVLDVYNASGSLVHSVPVTSEQVSLESELASGMYMYRFRTDEGHAGHGKLVIE